MKLSSSRYRFINQIVALVSIGGGKRAHAVCAPLAMVLAAVFLLLAGPSAYSQEGEGTGFMEEVVTVGTRSRTERTVAETSVPVDIFSSEDIARTGIQETARLLQFLAPSFNFSTSTISDGTDIVRPATLRGLGPDQTLVLVNGKRRHNSALMHVNGSIGRGTAGVDLNAIPPSAIKRIEILRDGASAQYGSDAIAGVINVVLKDQDEAVDFRGHYGSTYSGDGDTLNGSVNVGFAVGDGGFINITGEYRDREATNRSGRDPRQQFNFLEQMLGDADLQRAVPTNDDGTLDPTGNDGDPYCEDPSFVGDPNFDQFTFTTCTDDPSEATFNRRNHRYGDPDSENYYLTVNSAIPVGTGDTELYFFGGIARRDGESGGFYRRAEDARTVLAIHPEGFLPLITTDVDDDSLAGGVRGTLGDWDYDTSLVYGENEFEFDIQNSNNVTLGSSSPVSANAGTLSFDQLTFNLDAVKDFDWGWNDVVSVGLGLEWRSDGYEIEAGQFESWANGPDDDPATAFPTQFGGTAAAGIQVFPGFRPTNAVDEDRDSVGVYADFESNLTDQFFLNVAARYEDYDDFGDTLNGKLAGRFDVNETFALRGSVSTGFRAPSLHQQFFNNTSTQFVTVMGVPNTPVEVGTFANNSDVVRDGFMVGNLDEETSVNASFGFVWLPTDEWSITADFYAIDIEDRIVLSGRFSAESADANGDPCVIGTGNCPIAEILDPFAGVSAAQFFSNAIDTETRGIDIVISHNRTFGNGDQLQATLGLNFTDTELDGDVRTPESLQGALGAEATLFSRQEIIWLEDGQPENHIVGSGTYMRGPWSGTLRINHFGEVKSTEDASDPSADQTFDAATLVDLEGRWDSDFGLSVAVGGNNIFDEEPDENIPSNSFNGIFPFNRRTTPFGFNGGYWYLNIVYSLEK